MPLRLLEGARKYDLVPPPPHNPCHSPEKRQPFNLTSLRRHKIDFIGPFFTCRKSQPIAVSRKAWLRYRSQMRGEPARDSPSERHFPEVILGHKDNPLAVYGGKSVVTGNGFFLSIHVNCLSNTAMSPPTSTYTLAS